jgi:hypothetical protein
VQAARSEPADAKTFNLGGPATAMPELVAAIEGEVPGAEISFDDVPLPFPDELPEPWFDAPLTPLDQGIRETVEAFRRLS